MSGLSLHLTDDLLDQIAELVVPRVIARLGDLEPDAAAPVAYTIAALAESLGVSQKTIRGAINRGELPAQRRGRRFYIDAEIAREWARPDVDCARPARARARNGAGRPLREAFAQFDHTTNGGNQR